MKQILFSLIFCLLSTISIFGQERIIKGFLVDSETEEPLFPAMVIVPDTKFGAMTNIEGYFEITVPDTTTYLIASYILYHTQKLYIVCDSCVHKIGLKLVENFEFEHLGCNFIGVKKAYTLYKYIYPSYTKANNNTNTLSSLNSTTGSYIHSGTLNNNQIILRGVGSPFSQSNKVYYNGIPINLGNEKSILNDFDINLLDEIFIVKGPFSTLQGATLGGTILLENEEDFDKTNLVSEMSVGSYGLWRNSNKLQLKLDNGSLQLFQNTTLSEGYRENTEYSRKSVGMSATIEPNGNHKIKFTGFNTQVFGENPSSLDEETYLNSSQSASESWLNTNSYEDYNRSILGISHEYDGYNIQLNNSVFANFRNQKEILPTKLIDQKVKNFGWRPTFYYYNNLSNLSNLRFRWHTGAEILFQEHEWQSFQNENNQSEQIANYLEKRKYANIFSEMSFSTERLIIKGGVNFNKTLLQFENITANDSIYKPINPGYNWIFSPKLALNYTFEDYIELFVNVSHGSSIPSVAQTLSSNGLVNTDLLPEKGWSYEVGSKAEFYDLNLEYEVALYRMNISNFIVTEQVSDDSYLSTNAGATQHNGIEAILAYQSNGFHITTNYSYNNYVFKDFSDNGNDYSGNKIAGIPSNTVHASINYYSGISPIYGTLTYRFSDAIPIVNDNSLFTESYQLLDFKLGYKYELKKLTINTYFGVNNISNEKYASMIAVNTRSFNGNPPRPYYPGLPRNIYGGIKVNYEIK